MGLLEFLKEYKELITAVATIISGIIGYFTARAKQKREIRIIHRIEHAGGAAGAPGAATGPAPVELVPSWWRALQVLCVAAILSAIFGALAIAIDRSDWFFPAFGIAFVLMALFTHGRFLMQKLTHLSWRIDGQGLTIRRFGRERRYHWGEIASMRILGVVSLAVYIGHESAGYRKEIHFIPRALQMSAVGVARTAGVRITSNMDDLGRR